jgi:hypothetical protein
VLSQQKQKSVQYLGCAILSKIVPTEKVEGRESKRMASQLEPSHRVRGSSSLALLINASHEHL